MALNKEADDVVNSSLAIGIDLGSTYSCVGVWQNNWVEIIANEQGSRKTPSFVAFRDGELLVGDAATNQAAMNTRNTIFDLKRLIGRRFSDPSVQRYMEMWPFTVTPGPREQPLITVSCNGEERRFSAEQICGMLLKRIKEISDEFLRCDVRRCVITVPGKFSVAQREATANAGRIAGLDVVRIVNEPTAAACAYGLHRETLMMGEDFNLLVFDLGGGTLSVSVVSMGGGVIETKALAGDLSLGGTDFDGRMVDHFVKEFKIKQGKDITGSARAMRKLVTACERAKRSLSVSSKSTIDIDALFEGIDFYSTITRLQFEDINMDLFARCLEPVEKCLLDANIAKSDIQQVVLVGGSSRIPKVQQLLQSFFDGKELCKSHVNPDEAVAFGAAVLGHVYFSEKGERFLPLHLDVTPRSLGLEIAGGEMTVVIPQNSTIPARKSVVFCSYPNYETTCILLEVYEGEEARAADNELVGIYELCDLPAALPGGLLTVVTFEVDARGILTVTARMENGAAIMCIPRLPSTPLYPVVSAL